MQGEKALAAELMVAWTLKAGDSLSQGILPPPVELLGSLLAFGMLAGMALAGEHWAKLAGAFGSVLLLTIAMMPPDPTQLPNTTTNVPLLLRFFKWLSAWTGAAQGASKVPRPSGAGLGSPYDSTPQPTSQSPVSGGGSFPGASANGSAPAAPPHGPPIATNPL